MNSQRTPRMNIANFLLRLDGDLLSSEGVSCTGLQLIKILKCFENFLPRCNWYAADMSANNVVMELSPFSEPFPKCLESFEQLLYLSFQVDQFYSGIIFAVPEETKVLFWPDRSYITDDFPEKLLGEAIIELRLFDTSYFEIYSSEEAYLNSLASELEISPNLLVSNFEG